MVDPRVRVLIFAIGATAGLGCALIQAGGEGAHPETAGPSAPIGVPAESPAATVSMPSLTATPGLLLRGSVRSADGAPLPDVVICRSFASYPGRRVGTTDRSGDFVAEFVAIPGDEMIAVWPYREGYTFDPPRVYWRHYHGFETSTLRFTGSPAAPNSSPEPTCS